MDYVNEELAWLTATWSTMQTDSIKYDHEMIDEHYNDKDDLDNNE